jgi:DNA-directed RNA polymerase specialized sigma24 family protein
MADVTQILHAIDQGDPHAAEQLMPLVYDELRRLAAQKLAQEKPGQTLQATALVHEAYLRLVTPTKSPPSQGGEKEATKSPPSQGGEKEATKSPPSQGGEKEATKSPPSQGGEKEGVHWNSRSHFFAAAAEAMRRILVDQARRKQAEKHGGGRLRVAFPDHLAAPEGCGDDLVALDEALSRLERHDADAARLVKLRYFAGLSHQDAAETLGISRGAADRLWALGRAWLFRQLSK